MRSKRILLDLTPSSVAGQKKRALAFLERFRRFDSQSALYVFSSGMLLPDTLSNHDITLIEVSLGKGLVKRFRRLIWQNMILPRLIKRLNVDIYLSFSHYLPSMMQKGVLTVVGVSNLAPFSDLAYETETSLRGRLRLAILKRTILYSARRANRLVALSGACRQALITNGIDPAKITVISNGSDSIRPTLEKSPSLSERYGLEGNYLLYVSHFYSYKNFERLIEAYGRLEPEITRQFRLVLVGSPADAVYFRKMQAKIASLDSTQVVLISDLEMEELGVLYAHASAFVFPSLVEACPNSLLEAMSYGLPIITGNIEPMREFGGDAARYFDPLSAQSIADALRGVLLDSELRGIMGEKARDAVAQFTWDDFTAKVVRVYLA